MNIGDRGLDLIRAFEGFRAEPYRDAVGVPTIGYGSTYYPDGQRVRISDPPITREQATDLMMQVLREFEDGINAALRVEVTQNQYDALVCWAFNIGVSAAQNSTLMKKLNSGDYSGAADQFLRWNRAGGQVLRGLTRRREAERALFLEDA